MLPHHHLDRATGGGDGGASLVEEAVGGSDDIALVDDGASTEKAAAINARLGAGEGGEGGAYSRRPWPDRAACTWGSPRPLPRFWTSFKERLRKRYLEVEGTEAQPQVLMARSSSSRPRARMALVKSG